MRMVSKYHCPKCHKTNEVDYGDLNDLTQPDVEGYICWNCKNYFLFPWAIDSSIDEDRELNEKCKDANFSEGKKVIDGDET